MTNTFINVLSIAGIILVVLMSCERQVTTQQMESINGSALCTVHGLENVPCRLASNPAVPCDVSIPKGTIAAGQWKEHRIAIDSMSGCNVGVPHFCEADEGEKLKVEIPVCTPVYVPPHY